MKIILLEPGDQASRECFLVGFKKAANIELIVASSIYTTAKGQWFEKYADQFVSFSFKDFNALKEQIELMSVDAIVTYYDLCLEFVNNLNIALGKRPIYACEKSPARKSYQRSRLLEENLASAKFVTINNLTAESLVTAKSIGFPCVVKPCQLTSSLGVSICTNEHELIVAIEKALQADFWDEKVRDLIPGISSQVLVEQFLEGEEISVEGYVCEGRYTCLGFTKKLRSASVRLDELGHVFPHPEIPFEGDFKSTIEQYLEKVHVAFGVINSVTHAEVKINSAGVPFLVELNCRPGGGMITELMRLSGCGDVSALMVAIATGLNIPPFRSADLNPHSILFLYSDRDGQLKGDCESFARAAVIGLKSFHPLKFAGDFLFKADMNESVRCGLALATGAQVALPPLPPAHVQEFVAVRHLLHRKVGYLWATADKVDQCFALEKACLKEKSASRETIAARISLNAHAILLAYDVTTGSLVGFLTQVPIPKNWLPPMRTWEQLAALSTDPEYMAQRHGQKDLVSFGVSMATSPDAPHKLASSLFDVLASQIASFGCSQFVGGLHFD